MGDHVPGPIPLSRRGEQGAAGTAGREGVKTEQTQAMPFCCVSGGGGVGRKERKGGWGRSKRLG